nr:DUF6264 family protein [Agromyces sp. 3263]
MQHPAPGCQNSASGATGERGSGERMTEAVQPYAASAAPKRPVVMWDLVLTIVLLVVMIGAALLASFFAVFLAFAGDSCGASTVCDYDRMGTGMLIALVGPLVVGLLTLIAAVIVLVLRRIAFWIPIVGIVLVAAVFFGGAALTISGVEGATF